MNCPICGSTTAFSSDKEFSRCLGCSAVRTCYNYDAGIYTSAYAQTYVAYAENDLNLPLNLFRLGLVSRWLRKGDGLLDIGCGIGAFIRFAENYYMCVGTEPNQYARRIAQTRCHSAIYSAPNGLASLFQAVTMFDVLEHLENPVKELQSILAYLSPGGVLVITTPDVSCPNGAEGSIKSWKHYKPREHLLLHTPSSLHHLADKLDLDVLSIGTEESDIRPGNENGDLLTAVLRKKR